MQRSVDIQGVVELEITEGGAKLRRDLRVTMPVGPGCKQYSLNLEGHAHLRDGGAEGH